MLQPKPSAVTFFQIYCWCLAGLYFLVMALGVVFLLFGTTDAFEMERTEALIAGIFCLVAGAIFFIIHVVAIFLPRRPWVWIVDLILICGGFTSCMTLPFCVAMLIFWLKPETKAYFGRT